MSASPEAEEQRQNAPTVCLRKDSYIRLRDEVVKLRVRNNDLKVKLESSENATIRLQKDMEENNVVIENLKVSNEDLKQSKEELEKNENTNILAIEKLKRELEQMRGSNVQDNPWQIGVPYGFHGTGMRDRPRREGCETRERSRARF